MNSRSASTVVEPAGRLSSRCFGTSDERRLLAEEDVLFALEVGEDRPRRDVGGFGDLGERRLVVAALGEQSQRDTLRSSRASAASYARADRDAEVGVPVVRIYVKDYQ